MRGADKTSHPSEASGNARPESCHAAELRNGFTVNYVRYEQTGTTVRLFLCSEAGGGYVDFPFDDIGSFHENEILSFGDSPTLEQAAANGPAPSKSSLAVLISEIAGRYQLDPDFVASVVKAESGFHPGAISPKGAQGLMQLMPGTAAQLGVKNVFDPAANVDGGTKYLRTLLDKYKGDAAKALAAYNAGPQRVEQYGGVPPYRETLAYITRIINDFNRKKLAQDTQAAASATEK